MERRTYIADRFPWSAVAQKMRAVRRPDGATGVENVYSNGCAFVCRSALARPRGTLRRYAIQTSKRIINGTARTCAGQRNAGTAAIAAAFVCVPPRPRAPCIPRARVHGAPLHRLRAGANRVEFAVPHRCWGTRNTAALPSVGVPTRIARRTCRRAPVVLQQTLIACALPYTHRPAARLCLLLF